LKYSIYGGGWKREVDMNILLTGRPGIGKTTLIKKLIDSVPLSNTSRKPMKIKQNSKIKGGRT